MLQDRRIFLRVVSLRSQDNASDDPLASVSEPTIAQCWNVLQEPERGFRTHQSFAYINLEFSGVRNATPIDANLEGESDCADEAEFLAALMSEPEEDQAQPVAPN